MTIRILRLTLEADQSLEAVAVGDFDREFVDPDPEETDASFDIEDDELPSDIPLFPDGFRVKFVIRGSWEAEDGELTFRFEDVEVTFNDLPVEEFIVAAARNLAALLAEQEEIAEEDYAAFEEVVVTLFLSQESPEDFEDSFSDFGEEDVSAFEVDGNSMFFFEDGDIAAEFRRVTESVVEASTWGQVKSGSILRQPRSTR